MYELARGVYSEDDVSADLKGNGSITMFPRLWHCETERRGLNARTVVRLGVLLV